MRHDMNVNFLPKASLTLPIMGMVAVSPSWYALIIHPATTMDTPKNAVIMGKATAMDVALMDERIKEMLTVVNIKYLRLRSPPGRCRSNIATIILTY
ncbi:MAG: hypothetical protein XD68_1461 [Synergistales bacterium 54_24]|nr:MAG: hypothetical protein XD68_1461 [Synergistales bacterium 54_24]